MNEYPEWKIPKVIDAYDILCIFSMLLECLYCSFQNVFVVDFAHFQRSNTD